MSTYKVVSSFIEKYQLGLLFFYPDELILEGDIYDLYRNINIDPENKTWSYLDITYGTHRIGIDLRNPNPGEFFGPLFVYRPKNIQHINRLSEIRRDVLKILF